jgi:hypothetical protein
MPFARKGENCRAQSRRSCDPLLTVRCAKHNVRNFKVLLKQLRQRGFSAAAWVSLSSLVQIAILPCCCYPTSLGAICLQCVRTLTLHSLVCTRYKASISLDISYDRSASTFRVKSCRSAAYASTATSATAAMPVRHCVRPFGPHSGGFKMCSVNFANTCVF